MRLLEGRADIAELDAFLAELDAVADEYGTTVQAFDATLVAGREHLEAAVEHAERAFERGENVAREKSVEILLYAAGRRQIDRALAMGVREGRHPVAIAVVGGDESGAAERLAALLDPAETVDVDRADDAALRDFFDITDAERGATDAGLSALVRERVALLDVEK